MRVLLVGNTGYITKEFVQEAFPESEVFIMGNSLLKTERKKHLIVRPFPEQDEELEDIFHTYDFELMVYFSNYITFHGTMEGEAEKLRKVLSYCKRSKEIHVIFLINSGIQIRNSYDFDRNLVHFPILTTQILGSTDKKCLSGRSCIPRLRTS